MSCRVGRAHSVVQSQLAMAPISDGDHAAPVGARLHAKDGTGSGEVHSRPTYCDFSEY